MSYSQPAEISWDRPGLFQGVTIRREIEGQWYAWRIPHNGLVSQALAAELLDVSLMSIYNWVRDERMRHIKLPGNPSAIPLSEVKRIRRLLDANGRLGRER